jgi:hypothetical protein
MWAKVGDRKSAQHACLQPPVPRLDSIRAETSLVFCLAWYCSEAFHSNSAEQEQLTDKTAGSPGDEFLAGNNRKAMT